MYARRLKQRIRPAEILTSRLVSIPSAFPSPPLPSFPPSPPIFSLGIPMSQHQYARQRLREIRAKISWRPNHTPFPDSLLFVVTSHHGGASISTTKKVSKIQAQRTSRHYHDNYHHRMIFNSQTRKGNFIYSDTPTRRTALVHSDLGLLLFIHP
jgi:hypothetical protein